MRTKRIIKTVCLLMIALANDSTYSYVKYTKSTTVTKTAPAGESVVFVAMWK